MEKSEEKKVEVDKELKKDFLPMPGNPPAQQIPLRPAPNQVPGATPEFSKMQLIEMARDTIRGQRNLDIAETDELISNLEKYDQFAYATEVLLIRMKEDEKEGKTITLKDYETLAKFIYKDHSLPSAFKFEKALQELGSHEDLSKTNRCETLGLAAAIYKRKWQFDHQFRNLTLSRYYYKRGFDRWKIFINDNSDNSITNDSNDEGYNAINYAYINELMAVEKLEEHGRITGINESILKLYHEAANTRTYILKQFADESHKEQYKVKQQDLSPWVIATIAEALFGLSRYDEAKIFISQYLQMKVCNRWEVRSFSQQFFSLAYLQNYLLKFKGECDENKKTLANEVQAFTEKLNAIKINECLLLFNDGELEKNNSTNISNYSNTGNAEVEIKRAGKTGLGLSGGGFRSALFHIGVMAAMAEKNELRNVEVISCVSGGSIIGAYYYLKLKKLLETKNDDEITREDYIKLVKEIEVDFVKGIQHNLRMRIFSNLFNSFKMLREDYSRTHRLGELYERYLYKDLIEISRSEEDKKLGKKDGEIYMSDLFIYPKDAPKSFSIEIDNWKRKNKIPQLVLNATSVNTGHNWQFTASWMGEPPGNIQADIDVKPRLRRMYYQEAPENYKHFRLGYAVGASSCVPVMFQPMPLPGLYPGIDLQLIDGGVHDNQGIGALIEAECVNMIISDGSGQMATDNVATKNGSSLFFRSDLILQERVRELQFLDIKQRNSTTQINRLYTAHLKSDLENPPISWKFCTDPPRKLVYSSVPDLENGLTKYGVLYKVQLYLSQVRTDLDSFNDVESYALMYSGYEQLKNEYKTKDNISNKFFGEKSWKFLQMKDYLTKPNKAAEKEKLFQVASRVPFKMYYLSKTVKIIVLVSALALGSFLFAFVNPWNEKAWNYSLLDVTAKFIVITILLFLVGIFSKVLANLLNIKSVVRKKVALVGFIILGWIICNLYLLLLNKQYNRIGRLEEKDEKAK